MGRTVRFDQIYVSSLDADPIEQDVLTGVRSIVAGEVEADKIVATIVGVANTNPTKSFTVGNKFFIDKDDPYTLRVTDDTELNRLFLSKLAIETLNPTTTIQVKDNLFVDTTEGARSLLRIVGNTFSTNVIASNIIATDNRKLEINSIGSNILSVSGNTYSTNIHAGKYLYVGNEKDTNQSNVALFKDGNVVVENGFLKVYGGVNIYGNISVTESTAYTSVENLVVSNAVIQMGTGNDGSFDTGILMIDNPSRSNILAGYVHSDNEFKLSRTFGGPETAAFTVDTANTVNLHVYGSLYTDSNVGIKNTAPMHVLQAGSNLWVDDPPYIMDPDLAVRQTTANTLHVNGFTYTRGLRIGDGGLAFGSAVTVNPQGVNNPNASIISIQGNLNTFGIRTAGEGGGYTWNSGIANTSPQDTLSIGNKIFANMTDANTLTVLGTTLTQQIISQSLQVTDFIEVEGSTGIKSVSGIVVHSDNEGPDSASNALILKSGPLAANVSTIEVIGGKSSPSNQYIRFLTKNTERIRVVSGGNVGIGSTQPGEKLTIGGNLKVNGSNTIIFGNAWGTTDNTSMRVYSSPAASGGEHSFEAIAAAGKGINFKVGQTPSLGTAKLTILENGNVGIGTSQPQSRFQTSGGSVFVNSNVSQDGGFTHNNGIPLSVTNVSPITTTNQVSSVLRLSREGKTTATTNHGVRATFKMGKFEDVASTARSRLDIDLAHGVYGTDVNIMTLRSDGRVGVGTHTPEAKLMVNVTGSQNPNTNGILVTNLTDADVNQDAIITTRVREDAGDAFATYMIDNNGSYEGWSVGLDNRNNTRDFRITNNVFAVSNVQDTTLFIDGSTKYIGIGTDVPRSELEVNGKLIIGNELYFGGLSGDDYGNTFMIERLYDSDRSRSELLTFKGNDAVNTGGPDRIRTVAGEHIFQVYDDVVGLDTNDVDNIIADTNSPAETALAITPNGTVLIGGDTSATETSLGLNSGTKLYVAGGFEFATGQKISYGKLDIYSTEAGINIIDSLESAPLSFRNSDSEYARFTENGLIGVGTNSPSTNVHIYSPLTTSTDVLKLESPNPALTTSLKHTGILVYTDDGFGGFVRGYRKESTGVAGLVLGSSNNNILNNVVYITETSNVGIGVSTPASKLHVYNGITRFEHTTANAVTEFKTIAGVSNIYSDTNGNVHIQPYNSNTIIDGNVEITGNIDVEGRIDLGSTVGINLSGNEPQTALHVNGGLMTNTDQVSCKRYSNVFSVLTSTPNTSKNVQLIFGPKAFYAKVVAILRRIDNSTTDDMSTMVLELQGGTGHATDDPTNNISIGTKNTFGGPTNAYPWSQTITIGKRGISIKPLVEDAQREYQYQIFVELVSGSGGKLEKITRNLIADADLDDGDGGSVTMSSFTY